MLMPDVNDQLSFFLRKLHEGTSACFDLKTTTRKERDPPWINNQVRSLARRRRRIYSREGRSHQWKALMKKSRALVKRRASKYWENQKLTLLKGDANRAFFKNIKAYRSREKPPSFKVRSLFDNLPHIQVANRLADHFNGISKICLDGLVIDKDGHKFAQACRTQNLFRQIARVASIKGMKDNYQKTLLLCISDSRTYEAGANIIDKEGSMIESGKEMKILGLHFSGRPDVSAQVDSICKKFRSRIWYLRHLYHNGFSEQELLKVYKMTILPCHDYCSNVYHSSLTLSQSIVLECHLAKALKAIYGYEPSYMELMAKADLTTLRKRRESRELQSALRCALSPCFSKWFPLRRENPTRRSGGYVEKFVRCCRCYNSPLYYEKETK